MQTTPIVLIVLMCIIFLIGLSALINIGMRREGGSVPV
jgi:hypothetical protein